MCTSTGELLACQPYGGAKTLIADQGLGQGPNVVLGLAQQYGLLPGSKLSADNLFINFDLLDHMTDNGWGVVGTLRQNRLLGVPLLNKKDAMKAMSRGEMDTAWSENVCVTVWRDSKPVYVSSNFTGPEPVGNCQRYSGQEKGYTNIPCPKMILDYNTSMGGVDLLNQNVKNYAISPRLHKWYWAPYAWFLNVQMVMAWRLFRRTMKQRHLQVREEEKIEDQELEASAQPNTAKANLRKQREEERRKKRKEEKKLEEMSLLDFTRSCVEMLLMRHGEPRSQRPKAARASAVNNTAIRFDTSIQHIVIRSPTNAGVCQQCRGRAGFRCESCNVALHPVCFKAYHTPSAAN